jgi:hypothetical protein
VSAESQGEGATLSVLKIGQVLPDDNCGFRFFIYVY